MRKGLLLIIFVFVAVILCVSNVQATTGSSYSLDSFVASMGVADSHPTSINSSNNDVKEGMVLAARKKPPKKKAKKKFIDTDDNDVKEGMVLAARKKAPKPKKPKKK
jgi:hypothetical protein